jgi:hypothetical protein
LNQAVGQKTWWTSSADVLLVVDLQAMRQAWQRNPSVNYNFWVDEQVRQKCQQHITLSEMGVLLGRYVAEVWTEHQRGYVGGGPASFASIFSVDLVSVSCRGDLTVTLGRIQPAAIVAAGFTRDTGSESISTLLQMAKYAPTERVSTPSLAQLLLNSAEAMYVCC